MGAAGYGHPILSPPVYRVGQVAEPSPRNGEAYPWPSTRSSPAATAGRSSPSPRASRTSTPIADSPSRAAAPPAAPAARPRATPRAVAATAPAAGTAPAAATAPAATARAGR